MSSEEKGPSMAVANLMFDSVLDNGLENQESAVVSKGPKLSMGSF